MILYMSNHIRRQDGFPVHIQDGASSLTEAYRFLSVSRGEAVQSCFIQVKYKNTVDKTEHQMIFKIAFTITSDVSPSIE